MNIAYGGRECTRIVTKEALKFQERGSGHWWMGWEM